MPNFLEQLVAEWHEFRGYFVRRNVRVGNRAAGGYECELDVVAFHPGKKHLIHIEPSMDAAHWDERARRFEKKFEAGRKYIPALFEGFKPLPTIQHVALFVFAGAEGHRQIGGGRLIRDLMTEIRGEIGALGGVRKAVIPEQYVILRALQFAADYWR
jgi:hypothetical protein